jgi:hypothetical protein
VLCSIGCELEELELSVSKHAFHSLIHTIIQKKTYVKKNYKQRKFTFHSIIYFSLNRIHVDYGYILPCVDTVVNGDVSSYNPESALLFEEIFSFAVIIDVIDKTGETIQLKPASRSPELEISQSHQKM